MNPPEIMTDCNYSSKSYTWSLGIILFEIFYYEILEKRKSNMSIGYLDECLSGFTFPYNEKLIIIYFLNYY